MPKTHEFLQNIDCWEIYIYILGCADNCTPQLMCSLKVPWCFSGNIHTWYVYIESFFKKMMQTHPSMLEYASAGPCTLHPMRFPEATFFFCYLSIYLSFIIYVQYIYTHRRTETSNATLLS